MAADDDASGIDDAGDALVLAWAARLEQTDYFALLGLPTDGAFDDQALRAAFHRFALAFHPDLWRDAPAEVRSAASDVYCRGAEAYKALQDPLLRRRYLRAHATGRLRLPPDELATSERSEGPSTVASIVRSAQATPFAQRADELIAHGELRQARLQLQLALAKEPGNARLEERLAELGDQVRGLSSIPPKSSG